jgi:hypothetical protein
MPEKALKYTGTARGFSLPPGERVRVRAGV